MGLFNNPGPSVTSDEFKRVCNTMRSRHHTIPHELFQLWQDAADAYITEHEGRYKGMDAKELEPYMEKVMRLTKSTHPQFMGVLPDLKAELQKAVKGTYGKPYGVF